MTKEIRVTRDQAVWERETFWIEVPDDVPPEEIEEYCGKQIDLCDSPGETEVLGETVYGVDTIIEVHQ